MNRRKLFLSITLLLSLSVIIAACAGVTPVPTAPAKHLSLVTVSDIHSNILPYETKVTRDGEKVAILVGGMDRIAAVANRENELTNGATLLVSGGDNLMGFFFRSFDGVPEITSMNMAGYDITCLGNHDFDLGSEACKKAMKVAEFPTVSSNITIKDPELAAIVKPFVIKEVAGVKIGFFGLMTPDLPRVSSVGSDVIVDNDLTSVSMEMVKALREGGASIVIALTHVGKEMDEKVARDVAGIDIIVGGHSHDTFYEKVKGPRGWETIVVQAGVNAKEIGILSFDVAGGRVVSSGWKTVLLDETVGSIEEIAKYQGKYEKELNKRMNRPVGETLVDLDAISNNVRTIETNLGDFITDAWADWFAEKGAENPIALLNGGTIRGNCIYKKGPLTYGTLLKIHPFSNTIYEVSLSGKELMTVLEMSASAVIIDGDGAELDERVSDGGFFQISGLKIEIDLSGRPFSAEYDGRNLSRIIFPGERLVSAKVKENGQWVPIKGDNTYKVYVTSWTASGGDGYYPFISAKKTDTTVDIVDVLLAYLAKMGPVKPDTEGRIVVKERK
ncbi:MAG: 5'-nucleotidase C-terminal domain-containing protein [Deltaproteobacteria bacterium]|uniref:5'-nucleotidase C-terminal domain-containing protein n=1 Tax=Candidatus Zymogenus saltonus TaxID=2844893 RepID=A0A9D8KEM6_9DELT|nr:5'-nucleotidase C-terminal domain-containing protein [Candidatus Zymogenus saltonus]